MAKISRRRWHSDITDLVNLSDDEDELMELLSHSMSLNTMAENVMKMRRSEHDLIRAKLKAIRGDRQTIRVSDHAMIRYLERVVKLDIDALKKEMIGKLPADFQIRDSVEFITIDAGDMQYVIRDGLIISVTPIGEREILK